MVLDAKNVAALLSLLDETDVQLKSYALQELLPLVDSHWATISESLAKLEDIAEDERFPERETASALASRCFFHLEEYDDATRLALGSGKYFDVEGSSAYSKAIVGRCLDTYVNLRGGQGKGDEEPQGLDPKLEQVVERMFSNCYATKNFQRAIGMALEARRLDKLREAISFSKPNERTMLTYTLSNASAHSSSFRHEVMSTLVELYSSSREDDVNYLEWFVCLHALQRVDDYAALLLKLVCSTKVERALIAFQAAFDLVEFQDQKFEKLLDDALTSSPLVPPSPTEHETKSIATLRSILFEGKKAALLLDFMYKRNGTDTLLLKKFKQASDAGRKNSILHHAMIVAHGYAQCGTTADTFLRENLEWLSRASNWAKFGATASLGVVHKGNVESAMQLLKPYLPSTDGTAQRSSPYSEGGALYALGLIHCAEGVAPSAKNSAVESLSNYLELASLQEMEVARDSLLHGSCLGIGLSAMSSSDENLIERLRGVLYSDSAVVGEAAALGMGLVMLGGGDEHAQALEDLLGYAHDTAHEKIVRAIGICAALAYYGKEEQADTLIEQLCRDKDALIRYGGVYMIGSAYVGTANNAAVRRLLHIAVSDVSNDVRRAAVICLGLVMIRLPERLPGLIALLSESYNPHVRYGAALALGIGCSTQADPKAAIELLEPLLDDKTDFVRQGAMISMAFLVAPMRPEVDARAKRFREKIFAVVSDNKQTSTMSRMGALMASGIVDSGGRNAFLSLIGRNGLPKPPAVAGIILWTQYWFWYPLMHMLSLSLSPSALIGVNKDLDLPKNFTVDCVGGDVAKRFGMPDPVVEKKEEAKSRVKTAVLSTTAKVNLRQKQKASTAADAPATPPPSTDGAAAAAPGSAKKSSLPDDSELLKNPIRVTKAMAAFVRFKPTERYTPACGTGHFQNIGVVVLKDNSPELQQDVVKVAVPPAGDVDPNEPGPPEPFEWTPPSE